MNVGYKVSQVVIITYFFPLCFAQVIATRICKLAKVMNGGIIEIIEIYFMLHLIIQYLCTIQTDSNDCFNVWDIFSTLIILIYLKLFYFCKFKFTHSKV